MVHEPVGGTESAPMSLRERNRARARAEIAEAALSLFVERGFDAVTVEDIAVAVGMSRRTFFRYFESKEDALLADYPVLDDLLRTALAEAMGERSDFEAVRTALHRLADFYVHKREAVLARSKIIRSAAAPAARNLELLSQWERSIAQAVAPRLGADPTGLVPRAAAAMIVGAFRAALSQWVRSGARADLHQLLDTALDITARGLAAELRR